MSRSYRHVPIVGITTSESEREDKKIWHGRLRSAEKNFLSEVDINCSDDDNLIEPHIYQVSNVWDFAKDGKQLLDVNKNKNLMKYLRK